MYNGNISETYWRTSSDNVKRKYGYFYDNLNRLKNAVYQKPNLAVPVTNSYNESLTYDKNGNITSLFRNGEYDDAGYALEIDRLGYNYDSAKPNQLTRVVDESNNPNGFKDVSNEIDYTYDDFGNMESDANKGITRISYNHLNLPIEIAFGGTKHIRYLYNATGQKISKTVTDGSVVNITEYLDGYQYIKPGADNYKLHFFPHAEGYVNTIGGNNYVFNYTDHLGNIRLSYGLDRGVLTVLEENNYYPFGLKHDNYNITKQEYDKYGEDVGLVPCVNCAYNIKYNGKELQSELGLNWYDYGARNYDAAIGRWMNIDPMAEKFFSDSPYTYVNNDPLGYADLDGKDYIMTINYDKNGRFSGVTISGTVYIQGSGASKKRAEELNKYAKDIVKGGEGVSVDINYVFDSSKETKDLKSGENILTFDEKSEDSETSHVIGYEFSNKEFRNRYLTGNTGKIFGSGKNNYTVLHETLHLFGLADRYDDYRGSNLSGFLNKKTEPFEGFDNNIMAEHSSSPILHKIQYKSWYDHAKSRSKKNNNSKRIIGKMVVDKFGDYITMPDGSKRVQKKQP